MTVLELVLKLPQWNVGQMLFVICLNEDATDDALS